MAYVDILEGDAEGHIRFHSPEAAKAVSDVGAELQKEHSWKIEILSGMNLCVHSLYAPLILYIWEEDVDDWAGTVASIIDDGGNN